ncbi:urease accessory protein UreE [Sedimentitalea sp. JM2-8]|uniref:Urease accessory protein UreE n=1 Tax=Sedimentitalea xiamensis TaxID=3050037 RepID=A0ABT7FCR4_9RHOB|nr:urease accessory protein UreE [Sedimentitalea xiamensis]MDK3072910.1 urease accessory protein UreE [Sedimentitalea xiamensis]
MLLAHDERHVRRRVMETTDGQRVLVDLPEPVMLNHGDLLVLDNGAEVWIEAAEEALYDVQARDLVHQAELAWHIGNRHLAAEIQPEGIRILQDHVIRTMLEKLGATVSEVRAPFVPVRGAYSGTSASHGHHHHHNHDKNDTDHG